MILNCEFMLPDIWAKDDAPFRVCAYPNHFFKVGNILSKRFGFTQIQTHFVHLPKSEQILPHAVHKIDCKFAKLNFADFAP